MDTISGSCYSLNNTDKTEMSRRSLSQYDSRKFKTLLPQIIASAVSALFHVVVGISLAYSAILLPQLNDEKSNIKITRNQESWIASVVTIVVPISGLTCGFIMDNIGRLNTVKLSVIPLVTGWITIAAANGVTMLIIGRVITGIAAAWATSPTMVYITEIGRADMRGSLLSFAPAYTSLGLVLAYFQGWLMHWRTVAWVCNLYAIIPFILIMFIYESPAWLVSKGRIDEAKRSLIWFCKYQPQPIDKSETLAELHLMALIKELEDKNEANNNKNGGFIAHARLFFKPTGYKPLLILLGLFVFQQFSGIYITFFYSVTFFKEVGSNMDPYFASILIGSVRFFSSIINTYMLRTFNRRTMIIWGSAAMTLSMFVSGLFTYWIKEGSTTLYWIPIAAIICYVISSMMGLLSIPWTMTAEMFPIEIRGVAHSIVYSSAYILMFVSIQNYNNIKDLLNGVAGVQWFFAAVSLMGLVYAYIFLPETQGVKLSDIQVYFNNNCFFIGQKKTNRLENERRNREQNQELMNEA